MKLLKSSEITGNGTTQGRWFTVFTGPGGERFSLYSKLQLPDSVEITWAPPITPPTLDKESTP